MTNSTTTSTTTEVSTTSALLQQDIKFLESLREEAAFLFEHIVESGKSERQALEMVREIVAGSDLYLRKASNITVPIRFRIEWLQEHTNWSKMNYREKDALLWGLGMDTRDHKFEEGKLFSGECTKQGYKYSLVDFVYGQERLDKEWMNMKQPVNCGTNFVYYASEEARDYVWFRKHGRGAMM